MILYKYSDANQKISGSFLSKDNYNVKSINIMKFIYTGEDTWLFYEAQCVSCCKSVDYTSRHKQTDFLGILSADKGTTRDPLTSANPAITVREYHCLKQHYMKSIQKYLGNKNAQKLWHKLFQRIFSKHCDDGDEF